MYGSSRREFLGGVGCAIAATALPVVGQASNTAKSKFRFVHMTDLHIQPELGAREGVAKAVKAILALRPRPEFILSGGDHVMDVLAATSGRAEEQLGFLIEALKPLEMPIHPAIGNHDVFGWSEKSPILATDPGYGKAWLLEKFIKAPAYRSFDFGGWHFVVLDSIQAKGRDWTSGLDDDQLNWLKGNLASAKGAPTVLMTHMPAMSLINQYTAGTTAPTTGELLLSNGKELFNLIQGHNVKVVLQGHTHVVEACEYLGTQYITGGAVCGEWWKGPRLGVHPEGFMVYDVDGDAIRHQYVAYGWKARS